VQVKSDSLGMTEKGIARTTGRVVPVRAMDPIKVFAARVRAGDEKAAREVARAIKKAGSWVGGADALGVNPRTLYKWASEVEQVRVATEALKGLGKSWSAGLAPVQAGKGRA
jgi:hypothetical protein